MRTNGLEPTEIIIERTTPNNVYIANKDSYGVTKVYKKNHF